MSDKTKIEKSELYRQEYLSRINKVIDYIEQHLDESLSLEILANVAHFSPFHFHRIFSLFMEETLNQYLKRKRLERAASLIISRRYLAISDIGIQVGFTSNSSFSRAFKEHFKMSASDFRNGGYKQYLKENNIHQTYQDDQIFYQNHIDQININDRNFLQTKVEIKEFSEFTVAYCRHIGQFDQIEKAFKKLFSWAGPRGLFSNPDAKVLTLYHDDPKVTEIDKLQQSACLIIPEETKVEGEIGKMKVAGGKYACGRFEISVHEFSAAWETMAVGWFPGSGYECDDRLPFELYHNNHEEHPEKKFILDICIPVRPLSIF